MSRLPLSQPFASAALVVAALACATASAQPRLELPGLDGQTRSLSDLRGQVVVLNFWATWCGPCVEELPRLVALQRELGPRGVQVVGASADALEAREAVEKRADELELNFPVWLGATTGDMQRFGLPGVLPGTVVLGRDGTVRVRHAGVVSAAWLEENVVPVLDGEVPPDAADPAENAGEARGDRVASNRPEKGAATVPS
jgi:peroxiredoxin